MFAASAVGAAIATDCSAPIAAVPDYGGFFPVDMVVPDGSSPVDSAAATAPADAETADSSVSPMNDAATLDAATNDAAVVGVADAATDGSSSTPVLDADAAPDTGRGPIAVPAYGGFIPFDAESPKD
jgi:hypothetical protein